MNNVFDNIAAALLKKQALPPVGNDLPSQGGITVNPPVANDQTLPSAIQSMAQAAMMKQPVSNTTPLPNTAPPNPPPVNTNYTIAPSTDPNLANPPIDRVGANNPNSAPSPYIQKMADGILNPSQPSNTPDDIAPNKLSYEQLSPDGQITQDSIDYHNRQKNPLPQQNSFIRRLATGVLSGLAHGDTQNGIGGLLGSALGGGAVDAFSPKAEAQQRTDNELAKIGARLNTNLSLKDRQQAQALKQAQINTIPIDDENRRQQIADMRDYRQQQIEQRRTDAANKQQRDQEAATDKKMQTLAGVFNRSSTFDPDDPNNAAFVSRAKELGIPLFKKLGNKDIKYFQDEKTGAWFTTIADKQSGKSETHAVLKSDGNPLITTPKLVVQGENAANVANINQAGANNRTNINQAGSNSRLQTTLQNKNDQEKQRLAAGALQRWQQNYVKVNGSMPSDDEINQTRQKINSQMFGNQEQ